MVESEFKVKDVAWCKVVNFPWWPTVVIKYLFRSIKSTKKVKL